MKRVKLDIGHGALVMGKGKGEKGKGKRGKIKFIPFPFNLVGELAEP
ncbi:MULTISPECIES: hypothetical protein [unclassified Nostoc]|nr:hypothetical protein [Nostoc sp. DedQUE03]MDZ7973988.1 hypothetical protein [Nostoc sp. DedQUE03]MDZ8045770.1 hypothetical protein [Nostoc sp. DedQUE02]